MERLENLRQRHDQEAFIDQAQILQEGLQIAENNPLRKSYLEEAEKLLERALAIPGPYWPSAAVRRAKILLKRNNGQDAVQRAADLLTRASAMKNREAAYLLAELMENGIGGRRNVIAAKGLYQASLRMGYGPAGLALAKLESDEGKANVFTNQGLGLLVQEAKRGSADAARILADHYRASSGNSRERLNFALEWYRRASELGDAEASLNLGRMRMDSKSALDQPQEARLNLRKAANGGLVEAALALAADPYNGAVLGIPTAEAELWLNRAIETKAPRALLLGAEIRNQQGEDKREEARELLSEAVKNVDEDPVVLVALGRQLRNGDLIEQNLSLAISFFERAALKETVAALYEYGRTVLTYPDVTTDAMRGIAITRLQVAAERGHVKAALILGDTYLHGSGVSRTPSEALRWYQRAAESGSPMAFIRLGDFYALHAQVAEISRALEWYRKAADADIPMAMVRLGRMFSEGQGVPQDLALAATWFSRAAAAGSSPAMLELSALYSRMGGSGYFDLARETLEKAIRSGDKRAPIALAKLYLVRGEQDQAELLLKRAAGAENTEAALQLAELYLSKDGDQQNQAHRWLSFAERVASGNDGLMVRVALLWMRKPNTAQRGASMLEALIRKNNTEAMTNFAQVMLGESIYFDPKRAEALLQRAIELGNDNARFVLAKSYRDGNGIEKNPTRAVALYREIYNDEPSDSRALLALGDAYAHGEGVARNQTIATQFYELAARNGDPEGRMHLGIAYLYGGGVPRNGAQAEKLLSQASEANVTTARLQLGAAKASGMGVNIDPEGAFASYLRAAEGGSPEAMIEVARALREGFGTQSDSAIAQSWLERAARMGSQEALYELYRINELAPEPNHQEAERWLLLAAQSGHPAAMYQLALRYRPSSPEQNSIDGNAWLAKAAQAGHWQAIKAIQKKKLPQLGDSDDDE